MESPAPNPRRHDLDALRAFAMLLGVALHAALSFAPFPWPVQDTQQNAGFYVFFAAVHGFRMPLFFLLSGFFTAMLWRRRGLAATLSQRAKRILLPLVLSMVTIWPLTIVSFMIAFWIGSDVERPTTPSSEIKTLAVAARQGDRDAVDRLVGEGADVNKLDDAMPVTPLAWAALTANAEVAGALLDAGADPDGRNGDRATALHGAAFVGADDVVELLLERGGDPHAKSDRGEKPIDSTKADWETTAFMAALLKFELADREEVEAGRERAAELLTDAMDAPASDPTKTTPGEAPPEAATLQESYAAWLKSDALAVPIALTENPDDRFHLVVDDVFMHLWFLWFLCWLVALFAVYAAVGGSGLPRWLIVSPARWLLVFPATMIPQWFMQSLHGSFGPDTSSGILPAPHLLAYYAVFFFFGAAYYDADDSEGRLGRYWWAELLLALALLFPGMYLTHEGNRPASDFLLVAYTWAMCFGLMGAFRRFLPSENRTVRFVSDSSYWLYLMHLPLVFVAQAVVAPWEAPAVVKFALVCVSITAILLVSYRYLVRYTFIGRILNGPRQRPTAKPPSEGSSA